MKAGFLGVVLALGTVQPGLAADMCRAKAMIAAEGQINHYLKVLVENAPVSCMIMPDGKPGRCSVLCVSTYSMDQNQRRAALVYIGGAAGSQINKLGPEKFEKVQYMDRDLAGAMAAMSSPASAIADIQRRAKADQLDAPQIVALTMSSFKRIAVKPSKQGKGK